MSDLVKKDYYLTLLDKIFGLRSWGLFLYGALPANLTFLGAIKVETANGHQLLPFFLPASFVPVLITFLLIRARHRDWYLTADLLDLRSATTTFIILTLATLICGFSVIVHDGSALQRLASGNWRNWSEAGPIVAESFLLGVVSLVISSTLFMTVLTKNASLPGLPSQEMVKLISEIRTNLIKLKDSKVLKEYVHLDDNELIELVKETSNLIHRVSISAGNYLTKKSLRPLGADVISLIKILREIRDAGGDLKRKKWEVFFSQSKELPPDVVSWRSDRQEDFASMQRLKRLKLGGKYV